MAHPFYFFIAEAASLVLFMAAAFEMRRQGRGRFLEFVMIFFYGLILEELDMRFFKSYHYGSGFGMMLGRVPVSIALLWAVIVSGSMAISDACGLPEPVKPFFDALLAVWLDLSLDAIAIRVGFWSWVIPLNQGWFGVPAGNLYAWMWVAFFYSVFARMLRLLLEKDKRWTGLYAAIPFICYVFLFLQLNLIGFAGRLLGLTTPNQRLWLFAAQFLVFLIVAAVSWPRRASAQKGIAPLWIGSRAAIHLFFLFLFFHAGIYRTLPVLGLVSGFVMAVDFIFLKKVCHAGS